MKRFIAVLPAYVATFGTLFAICFIIISIVGLTIAMVFDSSIDAALLATVGLSALMALGGTIFLATRREHAQ